MPQKESAKSQAQYHFGIDFGTTNSSAFLITTLGSREETFKYGDADGRPLHSVVAIDNTTGEVFTGRDAWEKRGELASTCTCISSIKSILDKEGWQAEIAGKTWHVQDVAREVFGSLKCHVEERKGAPKLSVATVAVPIGFSRAKREVLRNAAHEAGIEVEAFVSEPTAAFFANYDDLRAAHYVVVFDWGGGTLDVSVMEHADGEVREMATAGMPIAGDAIDLEMARNIHAKIAKQKDMDISFDEMSAHDRDMLTVRAERLKRALSDDDEAHISLNRYGKLGTFRLNANYSWFSKLVRPIVNEAFACLDQAIKNAGLADENIDCVLMVGGSSNIGPLVEQMDDRFGDKLYFPEDTVWSISSGAAKLSKNPGHYRSAQDVDLILSDDTHLHLLREGESIANWKGMQVDLGLVDTAKEARFVFSGSADIDQSSERYQVVNIPSYAFLEEKLNLRAEIDEDGIFVVRMHSRMMPRYESERVWSYEQLKLAYSLEGASL